jgi:hypothetical protein
MKKLTVTLLLLALIGAAAPAQAYDWFWGATYGPAVPTSDTKSFIGKTSWRNFTVEGRKMKYGSSASFGLSFGWQVFNEKLETTTALTSVPGDLSGTQFRYLNIWPLLANAHYYVEAGDSAILFFGANIGAYIIEERVEMGFYAIEESNWHFGGAPEIGVGFPLQGTNLFFIGRYHVTTSAGNVSSQNYFTFSVGFGGR